MIATTIEQSKHLLELGLSSDSADMFWMDTNSVKPCLNLMDDGIFNHRNYLVRFPNTSLPAWSLSALLDVMPPFIKGHHLKIEKTRITDMWYLDYQYLTDSEPRKDLLTAAYEMVCWLLEQGLIKKGDNDD